LNKKKDSRRNSQICR